MSQLLDVRLDLSKEMYRQELAVATVDYRLGPPTRLAPDSESAEAHFIEPVTLIATVTIATLASRIVNHFLVKAGQGVLIDMTFPWSCPA